MPMTALFTALLIPLYLLLSARVVTYRRAQQISLNDKGDPALLQRMRAHGNFAEYAPLGLIALGLLEVQELPANLLLMLGAMLLLGRLAHAYAFWSHPMKMKFRVLGMALTFTMLGLSALALIATLLL